jgi:hypothetical protein
VHGFAHSRKKGQAISSNWGIEPSFAAWNEIVIPASTWINEFLVPWRYHGPQHFELPPRPDIAFAPSMSQHLQDALRYLTLAGPNLRAVPGACLNALDGLAKSLGYEGARGLPDIFAKIVPGLAERRELLMALKNYLNRWRHDNTPKGDTVEHLPDIIPKEAAFVYVATIHLITFLGRYLPQNNSE